MTRTNPTFCILKHTISALITALLLAPLAALHAADADVIVYASTPGGFCAAIAAAREGASVILLEPTDHVGGVNTGGLCFSDSNQTLRSTVMGLFDEWHTRIEADYTSRGIKLPYTVSEKDHKHWTYEPSVANRPLELRPPDRLPRNASGAVARCVRSN